MCMSKEELKEKVNQWRQYKRIIAEAGDILDSIEADIQQLMAEEETDTLNGDDFIITWKSFFKTGFDSKALKNDIPELYAKYAKQTPYKKFCVR